MQYPIYLDNNATTAVDPRVLDAMLPMFREHFGNPSSQTHSYGWYAQECIQIAREEVANFINAAPNEVIFTSGATEANNLAILGCSAALENRGRSTLRIISAATEHRSVLEPLAQLKSRGAEIVFLPVSREGSLDRNCFKSNLNPSTALISLMAANNEIGTLHPIGELAAAAREYGILVHTDATQAAGRLPIDVKSWQVDFLSLSAHKMYGPKGIGALYVRGLPESNLIEPQCSGGGQEQGLRGGTLNVPGIVGFGKACALAKFELEKDRAHVQQLTDQFIERLRLSFPELRLNGPTQRRLPGNLNLILPGISSTALLSALGTKIALSASSACSSGSGQPSHVLLAIGAASNEIQSSIRIGIGRFTIKAEIEAACEIILAAVKGIS